MQRVAQQQSSDTALHNAVWHNHLSQLSALLDAGAAVDGQDAENRWTPLHKAMYLGNMRSVVRLLQANASLTITDSKGRTPLDLASAELKTYLQGVHAGDLFSWGHGANYQLGTGATGVAVNPARVDSMGTRVVAVAAAKFHSTALAADGRVFTWGFGRGGRLGHPDSCEGAVIHPRVVDGLARRHIVLISAAKHHTVVATDNGEVWSWGSNRDGRLGYPAVDTQPTPRRVSVKQRVVGIAAANKHTVVLTSGGTVFSWGANVDGQLGYGTSDSGCNPTPRIVESVKDKTITAVAAAKRHTVVLTDRGEVWTWGHKQVNAVKVNLNNNMDLRQTPSGVDAPTLRFHRGHRDVLRPVAVAIAAGTAHSSVLTATGSVLTWTSWELNTPATLVGGALLWRKVSSIAAGKTRTAAVTDEGDVYVWEGPTKPADPTYKANPSTPMTPLRTQRSVSGGMGIPVKTPTSGSVAGSTPPRGASPGGPGTWWGRADGGSAGTSVMDGLFVGSWDGRASSVEQFREFGGSFTTPARLRSRTSSVIGTTMAPVLVMPVRVEGIKRVGRVAVGEKHSLALQMWCREPAGVLPAGVAVVEDHGGWDVHDDEATMGDGVVPISPRQHDEVGVRSSSTCSRGVPPLQSLCQAAIARDVIDPRNVLHVLEYAESLGAAELRTHCMLMVVANFDAVMGEARAALEMLSPHLVCEIERLYKARLQPAVDSMHAHEDGYTSHMGMTEHDTRMATTLQPGSRPTRVAVEHPGDDAEEMLLQAASLARCRLHESTQAALRAAMADTPAVARERRFQEPSTAGLERQKLVRNIRKKLQQMEGLAASRADGLVLDTQQMAKLAQQPLVQSILELLEADAPMHAIQPLLETLRSRGTGNPAQGGGGITSNGQDATKGGRKRQSSSSGSGAKIKNSPPASTGVVEEQAGISGDVGTTSPMEEAAAPSTTTYQQQQQNTPPCIETSPIKQPPADWDNLVLVSPKQPLSSPRQQRSGGKPRRGALSMSLGGGAPEGGPVPAQGNPRAPAWGRPATTAHAHGLSNPSLKDIQAQEAAAQRGGGPPRQGGAAAAVDAASTKRPTAEGVVVSLGDLIEARVERKPVGGQAADVGRGRGEERTVAWGGVSGASPSAHGVSFADIQAQQERQRSTAVPVRSWGASPPSRAMWRPSLQPAQVPTSTTPGDPFVPLGTSPSGNGKTGTHHTSRWYVPNQQQVIPLHVIQSEQCAIAPKGGAGKQHHQRMAWGAQRG